jgi:hypothetical protein
MTQENIQIKYLKLINGESLVVSSSDNFKDYKSKKYIEIFDPIEIKSVKVHHGYQVLEHYTMQPWIKMANTTYVNMPTDSIVAAVDLHEDAEIQYKEYIKEAVEVEFIDKNEEKKILESEDEVYGDTTESTGKVIH